MSAEIDYAAVTVPADKPPAEYTYNERRADILQRLREAGHPRAFTQRELAERDDCSPATVNNDMDVLADYVADSVGERHDMYADLVFQKCIRELLDEGEWKDAASTLSDWSDWVYQRKELTEVTDRLDRIESLQREQ